MKILITGTPGTGKTTNARSIAKAMKIPYANVTTIINTHPEVIDKIESGVRIIKPNLKKVLKKVLPKNFVIDTHLLEFIPDVDIIVILRCEPFELKKRLVKRKYKKEKIKDNLEVEILDYFTTMTGAKKKVIEIDTSKSTSETNIKKIVKMIKNKKWNKGSINWNNKKYLKLLN